MAITYTLGLMSVSWMYITTAIGTPSLGHIGTELSPVTIAVNSTDITRQNEVLNSTCNEQELASKSRNEVELKKNTEDSILKVENISDHQKSKTFAEQELYYKDLLVQADKLAPLTDDTYYKIMSTWYEEKSDLVSDLLSKLSDPIKDPKSLAFILSIVSFTVKVTLCTSVNQFLLHVADFMRENYLLQVCKLVGKLKENLSNWFHIVKDTMRGLVIAEGYFEQGIDIFLKIIKGSICAAISNIILTLVGLKFFDYDKAMSLTNILGKPKGGSIFETLEHVLGNVKILMLGSYEALFGGKSLYEVITADYSSSSLKEDLAYLKSFKDLRYIGLPIEGYEEEAKYAKRARDTQEKYKSLQKSLPRSVVKSDAFLADGVFINTICGDIARASSSQMRVPPFGVILQGKPGIGKAGLVSFIPKIWAAAKGVEYDPTHVYHRNPHDAFWPGFSSQSICHMSEVGNLHANLAKTRGDDLLNQVLSLIDSQPLCLEMAAVEDKGKAWANFQLVIIDTNNPSLNAQHVAFNAAAIARRFVTITVSVRPEYQKEGSCEIDSEKAANAPGHDVWLFDISQQLVDPIGNTSTQVFIKKNVDIREMTNAMHALFIAYLAKQAKAADVIEKMDPKLFLEARPSTDFAIRVIDIRYYLLTYRIIGILYLIVELLFPYYPAVANLVPLFVLVNIVYYIVSAWVLTPHFDAKLWAAWIWADIIRDQFNLAIWFCIWAVIVGAYPAALTTAGGLFNDVFLAFPYQMTGMEYYVFSSIMNMLYYAEITPLNYSAEGFRVMPVVRAEGLYTPSPTLPITTTKFYRLVWQNHNTIAAGVYAILYMIAYYYEYTYFSYVLVLAGFSEVSDTFMDIKFCLTLILMRPSSIFFRISELKEDWIRLAKTTQHIWFMFVNVLIMICLIPIILSISVLGSGVSAWMKLYKLNHVFKNRQSDFRFHWFLAKNIWFPVEKPLIVPAKIVRTFDSIAIATSVISLFAVSIGLINSYKLSKATMRDGVDKGVYQNTLNNYTFRKGWEEMNEQVWPWHHLDRMVQDTVQSKLKADSEALPVTEGKTEARLPGMDAVEAELGCAIPPKRTNKNIEWPDLKFSSVTISTPMLNEYSSVRNAVCKNLRFVTITNGVGKYDTHILGTHSNIAIVNRHVVRQLASGQPTSWTFTVNTGGVNSEHRIDGQNLAYLSGDLMLVMLSGLRFKDIRQYFVQDKVDFTIGVKGYIKDESTTVYSSADMEAMNEKHKFKLTDIVRYDFINHQLGQCGNPLFVRMGAGWGVAAIHSAGVKDDRRCFGTLILRSQIDEAHKTLQSQSGLVEVLSEGLMKFDLEEPHVKHPIWGSYTPGIQWYGQIKGSQAMKGKSKIELSPISEDLPNLVGVSLYEDGVPKYGGPDLVSNKPWKKMLDKYEKPLTTNDAFLVRETISCIVDYLKQFIGKISPLTLDVALNGAPEDAYIRGINTGTSGGYGYPGGKAAWIYGQKPLAHFVAEIQADILFKIGEYREGRETMAVIMCALKDEVRALEKLARIFCMTDTASLALQRMMLAPIYSALSAARPFSGSCVGINMQSKDVGEFVDYLSEFLDIMEGDYEGFDDNRAYSVAHMATSIVYELAKEGGYNQGALQTLKGVLSETLHPLLSIFGVLGCFFGKQPSGKYGTAEDNCLRNLIMLIYFILFQMVEGKLPHVNPFEIIRPATYGDDLLNSIDARYKHVVNMTSYQAFCLEHYGMVVTAANKSKVIPPTNTIHEVAFLKRKFVQKIIPDGTLRWIAPLEMNSIAKCMGFILPSNNVDKDTQLIESCISASRELVLHFDRERHYKFRHDICNLLGSKLNRDVDVLYKVFPTYEKIFASMFPSGGPIDEVLGNDNEIAPNLTQDGDVTSVPLIIAECKPTDSFRRVVRESTTFPDLALVVYIHLAHDKVGSLVLMVDINPPMHNFKTITKALKEKELIGNTPLPNNTSNRWKLNNNMYQASIRATHPALDDFTLEDLHCNPQMRYDPATALAYRCKFAELNNAEAVRRTSEIMDRNHKRLEARRKARAKNLKIVTESTVGEMIDGPAVGEVLGTNLQVSGATPELFTSIPQPTAEPNGNNTQYSLDDFFERPFSIHDVQAAVGSAPRIGLNVWELWSNSESVRMKMRNYTYFKGTLCVRISITGTPFHYGRFMVAYYPYPVYNEVLAGIAASPTINATNIPFIYLSQSSEKQMTIDINANQPLDIEIPFCSTKQAFSLMNYTGAAIIPSAPFTDFALAGNLYIWAINPILLATESADSPISLNVMAWAKNVELSVPTSTVILTEGKAKKSVGGKKDKKVFSSETVKSTAAKGFWKAIEHDPAKTEYNDPGPLTQVSSVVADIGEKLSDVPFIGSFAQATGKIAGKLGQVFSMFGWSRPVILEKPIYVKNMPYTNGATTAGGETTYKLSVDPKQEVTVDPTISGGLASDELCFATLNSRESYLTTFAWDSSDVALVDELWVTQVMPTLCDSVRNGDLTQRFIQPTILGFTSIPFDYWHGDITFRFDIVCSKFHRGKLLITFEPNIYQRGLITSSPATFNQQNSLIIDIQEVQEVEFEVQWCSDWRWLPLPTQTWGGFTSPTFTVGDELTFSETSLGYISVTPLNELVQPIDNAPININVYVRSDRMEYSVPTNVSLPALRLFTESKNVLVPTGDTSELDTIVNFGEKIPSFRSLLKRYQVVATGEIPVDTDTLIVYGPLYPPIQQGYLFSAGTNYRNIYEYLRYAYFSMRGGMRYRFRAYYDTPAYTWAVVNRIYVNQDEPFIADAVLPSTLETFRNEMSTTFNGGNAYHNQTNGGIEFEVPYYSNQNFMISPQQNYMTVSPSISSPEYLGYTIAANVGGEGFWTLEMSTAEDFNFSRFLGSPGYVEDI